MFDIFLPDFSSYDGDISERVGLEVGQGYGLESRWVVKT